MELDHYTALLLRIIDGEMMLGLELDGSPPS